MIENHHDAGDRRGSKSQRESTLLPMLIAGLVTIVVGLTVVAWFV